MELTCLETQIKHRHKKLLPQKRNFQDKKQKH